MVYADLRFEVMFHRSGAATNGEPRDSNETESAGFCVSVHASGGKSVGHGQFGAEVGRLACNEKKLVAAIRRGLEEARNRAKNSAREKDAFLKKLGDRAGSLVGGSFVPREAIRDEVAAVFRQDPRTLGPEELKRITLEA